MVGPVLFLWLSVSIFHQLKAQPDLQENIDRILLLFGGEKAGYLLTSILLVCLNWGLEARKWQLLLLNLESISFSRSFKATLSGVAFALNTPNRIGEYGGRVLYLKEGNRLKAVSLTIVGSVSQLLITLLAGLFGMLLLREQLWSGPLYRIAWAEGWFSGLLTTACLVIGLFYFRVGKILGSWRSRRWFKGLSRWLEAVEGLSANLLLELLTLSFLRYTVFVIQYVLVLRAVGVEADVWTLSWLVTVFFLWLSIGPTIALLELGLRWEYSLLLFGMISPHSLGIYMAATLMWLINLVLPALMGSLLMLGVRLFRKADNLQV